MNTPFRVGTKVYLRPFAREEAPQLARWINDPEVTRTLLMYRPMSVQAEEAWVASLGTGMDDIVLGIALKDGDALIGSVGLHRIDWKNRHASFGILIGEKGEWGKGYGTEATALMTAYAFDTLNLNRVWLHVYENNARGLRAYEKVGFRREGVLRQETFRQGRYFDAYIMAILRQDWEQRSPIGA